MKLPYETFVDQAFVRIFRMTPEVISVMGLSHLPQFSGLGGKLNDYSLAGQERQQTLLREVYQQHRGYDFDTLTPAEPLTYQVFEFFLQYLPFEPWAGLAGDDFRLYAYPVCHHDGAPAETFNLLVNFHDIQGAEDADNYLQRLAALPAMFSDLEQGLRHRHALGLTPPESALRIIVAEMASLIGEGPDQSELLTSFNRKLAAANTVSGAQRDHYCAEAERLVGQFYQSGLPAFLSCLKGLLQDAGEALGVARFERGEEYYQYCLIRQTSTRHTADEIYRLGKEEVARLKAELAEDVEALGYDGTDLRSAIAGILRVEANAPADTEDHRNEILLYYRRLVNDTAGKMRPYFNLYPQSTCRVKATPSHLETGRTTTYYPASATGEYPGTFELNLGRELNKPEWSRNNLAYHEAYPGHHLQITLAQELEHLSLFRRTFVNGGYLEGWAKYAERLPFETGVDTDARYELQRKATELLSASNLMLDVGIHTRGWKRREAVAFSCEQALVDEAMAEYLVDRITVTPAQVTAYVLGLITVRQQRNKARRQLGEQFSLPDFHDAMLGEGALPLDLLERHISRSLAPG